MMIDMKRLVIDKHFQFGQLDDKRARGANVDHIEVFQLLGQHRRAKRPMSADVDASKEYHECHGELIYTALCAQ
jgi:hypothetical protein